jgi:hypothetical protein
VLEAGGDAHFALEPGAAEDGTEFRGQYLEHHRSAEGNLLGQEDSAHPATAEFSIDPVGAAEPCLELLLES